MPRIQVIADDGRPTLDELIHPEDLSSAHFRRGAGGTQSGSTGP